MDIFSFIPEISMAVFFCVFGALFVWIVIRRYAPVATGKILGPHEIIGRKADGSCERFKANLVEVNTHNKDNVAGIKRVLAHASEQRLKSLKTELSGINESKLPTDFARAKAAIDEAERNQRSLESEDMGKFFRVVAFRDRFEKHVLLQWMYVEKSLNEYATPEGNKFTLSFGFQSKGVILGSISDEKNKLNLPRIGDLNLGKFTLHYFIPDVRKESTEIAREPPAYLARIALFVPASLELTEELKSAHEQLRDKDRKLIDMGHELSANAAERDGLRLILKKLGIRDPEKLLASKKFDILDLALVSLPTLFGYFVVQSMGVIPVVGVFIGLLGGAGLVAFLRR